MNVQLTHAADGLERRAFTVADCFAMVEAGIIGRDERFELIGGEIVPMSPKGIRHELIKTWLNEQLISLKPKHIQITSETTFRLSDDTFIEPDFVVYPSGELESLSPENCKLAIEIADSSRAYDLGRKAQLYASFGIAELWVIDVNTQETHIHQNPSGDAYQDIKVHKKGDDLVPSLIPTPIINLKDFK